MALFTTAESRVRILAESGDRSDAGHDNQGQHHGVLDGCWAIFVSEEFDGGA
jgi:hypothetical protein